MSRRKPLDIPKTRRRDVVVQSEQQKITDGSIIQFAGHMGVHSDAVQCVAQEKGLSYVRIVERLQTEMISCAK
jgi:hypothetical protein